jgi:hypothetical protein
MNEMQIDVKKSRLVCGLPHDVSVPKLFKQGARHKRLEVRDQKSEIRGQKTLC